MSIKPGKALLNSILLCVIILNGSLAQSHFQLQATDYGILPRSAETLSGVLTMPLFHASAEHLWGNLLALFSLSFLLGLFAPGLLPRAILIMWLLSGFILWTIGRPLWHIGASGLVYGLIAWFPAMAILRRNQAYNVLTLLVLIYYGSAIWGLFPGNPQVSYEGHISGLISGIITAIFLRNHVPQDPKTESGSDLTEGDVHEDRYMEFDFRQERTITPDDNSE
jgi:membrane associated rhomboid family serine protease